jgi:RimJ/RimL family protein N-acetyltransferase
MKLATSLISFRRITAANPADVDFIRVARNHFLGKNVYPNGHFFQPDEHARWFSRLDPERDFFFLIFVDGSDQPAGYVGCDRERVPETTAEISIYITAEGISPLVPYHAMTLMLEFIFHKLKRQRAYGVFYIRNDRAIRFNSSFGFRRIEEKDQMLHTELTSAEYDVCCQRFRKFLAA